MGHCIVYIRCLTNCYRRPGVSKCRSLLCTDTSLISNAQRLGRYSTIAHSSYGRCVRRRRVITIRHAKPVNPAIENIIAITNDPSSIRYGPSTRGWAQQPSANIINPDNNHWSISINVNHLICLTFCCPADRRYWCGVTGQAHRRRIRALMLMITISDLLPPVRSPIISDIILIRRRLGRFW
jgi:hypothetical protein